MSSFYVELKKIGIDILFFLGGVGGAFVSMRKSPKANWKEWLFNMTSGGITAMFLTPFVGDFFKLKENGTLFTAFIIGFAGFKTAEFIIDLVKLRFKTKK